MGHLTHVGLFIVRFFLWGLGAALPALPDARPRGYETLEWCRV